MSTLRHEAYSKKALAEADSLPKPTTKFGEQLGAVV
jgi:hypothetical protein